MKKFSEHIKDNKLSNLLDNKSSKILKESLLHHIEVDDFFLGLSDMYIYERHGHFDNSYEIAQYILEEIKNMYNDDGIEYDIDISNYDTFVDRVCITPFEANEPSGAYDIIDNGTLFIDLYFNKKHITENESELLKIIIHEMLHGYEDYNVINNTGKSIRDMIDNKYNSATRNLNNSNDNIKTIARAIYLFDNHEQKAYISQIEVDIRNIIKRNNITLNNPKRYKIITDKLERTDIWKIYIDLANDIMNADEKTVDNTYKMFDRNFSGVSAKKDLMKRYNSFKKKFDKVVSKIIFDVLSENEVDNRKINRNNLISIQAKDLK